MVGRISRFPSSIRPRLVRRYLSSSNPTLRPKAKLVSFRNEQTRVACKAPLCRQLYGHDTQQPHMVRGIRYLISLAPKTLSPSLRITLSTSDGTLSACSYRMPTADTVEADFNDIADSKFHNNCSLLIGSLLSASSTGNEPRSSSGLIAIEIPVQPFYKGSRPNNF